jgi:hypothetical protein
VIADDVRRVRFVMSCRYQRTEKDVQSTAQEPSSTAIQPSMVSDDLPTAMHRFLRFVVAWFLPCSVIKLIDSVHVIRP